MQRLEQILKDYWGYTAFRPMQREAMGSILEKRDSVVVLPTGGGKSLCFQAPALLHEGLVVVVSPLISLMKDQVDALVECGLEAACLNSTLSRDEQWAVANAAREGTLKFLYVAPERLVTERFMAFLHGIKLAYFVIDEAHCVSMWGHDFRPEYRQLSTLKEAFPEAHIHTYTATATEHVRDDIAKELHLKDPKVIVGSFDRPNLIYRFMRRQGGIAQIARLLERHKGESGIVYCIRRRDVDQLCAQLCEAGHNALPYHAGIAEMLRKKNQERFMSEEVDIIVATVAFGMGIDKSNVRFVVHAAMPKSLEHYQQESGRAGRDGLEASCYLLYGGNDYNVWRNVMQSDDPQADAIHQEKLNAIQNACNGVTCRHRFLLAYFGQAYEKDSCDACDVCLGELDLVEAPLDMARKMIAAIRELGSSFGAAYTSAVLAGSSEARVKRYGHDALPSWGTLSKTPRPTIHGWLEQLVEQGYVKKTGEYNVLAVTPLGLELASDEAQPPKLIKPAPSKKAGRSKSSKAARESWDGVDEGLFEHLRRLRMREAKEIGKPAFVVFGDTALRDMARKRPTTLDAFLDISGVGKKKCKQYGQIFSTAIREYCEDHALGAEASPAKAPSRPEPQAEIMEAEEWEAPPSAASQGELALERAYDCFYDERSVADTARTVGRNESWVIKQLERFLVDRAESSPYPWVDEDTYARIRDVVQCVGSSRVRTIFEQVKGEVTESDILLSLACLRGQE